jgi:hypothetical protein
MPPSPPQRSWFIRTINAPATLWLLSAFGISIFSTGYTARNQCMTDAKQIIADYPDVLVEWGARLQPLTPILDMQSMQEAVALVQKTQKQSALSAFRDFTTYDVLRRLRKDRDAIDFSAMGENFNDPLKIPEGLQDLEIARQAAQAFPVITYDNRLSPEISEGMVIGLLSVTYPDSVLPDLRTALLNLTHLLLKENFRLYRAEYYPNCSYVTVFRQMLTGRQAPLVVATPKVTGATTQTPKPQAN